MKDSNAKTEKYTKNRIIFMLLLSSLAFFGMMLKVGYIQISQNIFFQKKAYLQRVQKQDIFQKRGTIYDRNNKELAKSNLVKTIGVASTSFKKLKKDIIAKDISKILNIDENNLLEKLNKNSTYERIASKVDIETSKKVEQYARKNNILGFFTFDNDFKRVYFKNNFAAQVIGFTGDDNQGINGIEKKYDSILKGSPGKIFSETDPVGVAIPYKEEVRIDAEDGLNIILTIDETIQNFAEKALQKGIEDNNVVNGGTVIVMEPKSGDILAMVSKPDFDLNNPYDKPEDLEIKDWKKNSEASVKILESKVWRNMGVGYLYEPGSTFKAVTTAMGLEENIINENTNVDDFAVNVNGAIINCWSPSPHGKETFAEGVYNSCNPVFVKLSQILGIERFYKYFKAFGFEDSTYVNLLGENNTIVHKKPSEIDMAVASFGQRFEVTPLHIINAYCAIANGGKLMKPRIIKEFTNSNGDVVKKVESEFIRNVISKETSKRVLDILEGVVSKGTGKNAYVRGYKVGGKTGTSETDSKDRFIASFSAIAPSDNPAICVLVVLDNPKGDSHAGGVCAAPIAGKIIEESLNYLGIEKRNSDKDIEVIESLVQIPDVKGKTIAEAKDALEQKGFVVNIQGDKEKNIERQFPLAHVSIQKGGFIQLYTLKNESDILVKVPDLKGLSINDAIDRLNKIGLNIKIKGTGFSSTQNIKANTSIAKGSTIEVNFVNIIGD